MTTRIAGIVAALLLTCSTLCADVRVPRILSDNMILQQQSKNAVWGWAEPGETVTVKASWGASAAAEADARGQWKLFLNTPAHATGHSLTIAGNNTIRLRNVAIGEVWLCAGQSNMGWSMGNSFESEKEVDVALPNFRIFKSQREHWHEPLGESRDRLQQWKLCDSESAAETSAVSYYFGKTLHQTLDVPVGIIVQAYAGTPIEGWMPWEIQKDDARTIEHKKSLDENARRRIARGETVEQALATFEREFAVYNAKIDAGETMKNAFRPLQPPFITKPASLGHQYPAHIFNAMICPIRPYGIRGMIWYQGERNSKNVPQAVHYRRQLAKLIHYYRSSWHELSGGNVAANFPFQFTQLPSWNPAQTKPVEGLRAPWAANRESMRQVDRDVPATGMVVSIDTGDAVALHPKNKKPIGIRHALLALEQTFGRAIVGSGPRYKTHHVQGDAIVLEFDSVGSGLKASRSGRLDAFAIAGEDRNWHWANAKIDGDTVVVSSDDVSSPVAIRYAWAMNPSRRNLLYNKEGLPASPFRTDTWPLFDTNDEIVEVNKPQKPEGYQAVDWSRPVMRQVDVTNAQSARPVVESLGDDHQARVTFLNPQYLVFAPHGVKPDLKIPLVIYLHGAGGVGDDATKNTGRARGLITGLQRFNKGPFLVVAPQCRRTSSKTNERGIWLPVDLELLLQHLKATHPEIDADRIYLTGNSMGGYGCWVWGGHHPEHFAAIAPIVGGIGRNGPKDVKPDLDQWAAKLAKVPVYAFVGAKDRVVPAERSVRMIDAIRKAGGTQARIKIYREEGHGASKAVFASPEYFDWMFRQKRTAQSK